MIHDFVLKGRPVPHSHLSTYPPMQGIILDPSTLFENELQNSTDHRKRMVILITTNRTETRNTYLTAANARIIRSERVPMLTAIYRPLIWRKGPFDLFQKLLYLYLCVCVTWISLGFQFVHCFLHEFIKFCLDILESFAYSYFRNVLILQYLIRTHPTYRN